MKYQNYPVARYDDLREMLRTVCEKHSERTAFLQKEGDTYRSYRYGRLLADVNSLGTALTRLGLRGKKILLMGKNGYDWAVSYLAVVCGVGTVVPLNPELSEADALELLRFSEASAVICEDGCAEAFRSVASSVRVIRFSRLRELIQSGTKRIRSGDRGYLDAPIDPDAMCALMFSSGTFGETRGVMLSHRNLCFNLAEMCSMVYIGEDDVFLSVLPVHHIYECVAGLLCPLSRGASVAFSDGLEGLGGQLRAVQPTVMNCVPAMLEGMYRNLQKKIQAHGAEERVRRAIDVTNAIPNPKLRLAAKQKSFAPIRQAFGGRLRLMITGGANASADVIGGFWDLGIPVIQGYGVTECAPLIALNRDSAYKADAVGLPTPNALLDIAQMQDDGIGEIRYRGDGMMLGYYRMPEQTQKVIRGGWFYTGDMGYLDEDGFLHVMGRIGNVIVGSDGRKIFPEELEQALLRSPLVRETVVVSRKDSAGNPRPVAWIYPDRQHVTDQLGGNFSLDGQDRLLKRTLAEVNSSLPPHKRIDSFLIRDQEFPKTATRKIKRTGV